MLHKSCYKILNNLKAEPLNHGSSSQLFFPHVYFQKNHKSGNNSQFHRDHCQ